MAAMGPSVRAVEAPERLIGVGDRGRVQTTSALWIPFGDTLPLVLRLLCCGHIEEVSDGLVGWCFDDLGEIQHQLLRLCTGMNILYDRLDLPESTNRRVTEEVAQLVECMLQ